MTGVEPLMQKIHNEIRRVDAEILVAVRQQVKVFAFLGCNWSLGSTLCFDGSVIVLPE